MKPAVLSIGKFPPAVMAALERVIGALNRIRGVARTRTTVVLSTRFEGRVQAVGIDVVQAPGAGGDPGTG